MRHVRIFLLNLQYVLSHRGRPLVYVFTYVFTSLLFLAFIRGVFKGHNFIGGWDIGSITSYYFLLIPAAGTLMTHPEYPILRDDIERGELAGRLLKPFSYYWQRFYIEIPVRVFQSVSGVIIFFMLSFIFGSFLKLNLSIEQVILFIPVVALAYMICFTMKMLVAIIGLWTTDIRGIRELIDVLVLVFAGYSVPVNLLPGFLEKIAYFTPFPYIIYFPVVALVGKLSSLSMINLIAVQAIWLIFFILLYRHFWKKGLMRFTDLGH